MPYCRVRRNSAHSPRLVPARWARAGVALAVGVAMVLGVQQQGLTAAASTRSDPDFTPRKDKPIKGRNAVPEPRPVDQADARALRGTPTVRWPDKGAAEVAVPQPGGGNTWTLALNGGRSAERVQAGDLPVWVAPTAAAARERLATGTAASLPAKVRVESLGRQGDGFTLKVQRADGVDRTGRITLGVDYRAFRDAFGGDWGTRLRLVTEQGRVIPTRNNGSGQLAAEVPVTAAAQTFVVAAGESSGAGDYKRGDLSGGAATWTIGGSSGDFEWSLPLTVPPAIGGPEPSIGFQYSSGALDGLSSATNNQVSVVGQGFSLTGGGSIERRYKSCAKDKNGNNGTSETGDLCFAGDSLSISVNGKSGSLVLHHRDATSEVWRMRGDDGSIVERLHGTVNGDEGVLDSDKGEYWRMTSSDGTQYYFGRNRLPGWQAGNTQTPETKSAWTVPVFGNHSGEQCNRAAFANSSCQQAYQWNLDYVVDRHGNTMSLYYDVETGNYARNLTATSVSSYVRAGNLKRIEYGQRDGQVFVQEPVAQVLYTTEERCTPLPCGPSQQSTYPDTPWDLNCASTTNCNNHYTPTFWTQKRLAKITTQVWRANTNRHEDVESWSLRHEYLRGDNSDHALWLEAISLVGLVGGAQPLPEINFDGVVMANRVDSSSDMVPPLEWFRINAVHYGTGGDLSVNYEGIDCTPTSLPVADNNDRRCRPQKWTPEGAAERNDWYHKYVVKNVIESDRTVRADDAWQAPVPVVTTVQYLDKPAWRFAEIDAGTDLKDATWSEWRGYGKVRLIRGIDGETKSVDDALFFRGMDGDRRAAGSLKDVKIKDSTGVEVDDTNEFSGQAREKIKYNGAAVVDKTITDYWLSAPTASMNQPWGMLEARRSGHRHMDQWRATDTGLLKTGTENTFDTAGRLASKEEANNVGTTTDDTCTRYQYVENPTKGLLELPVREQVVAAACAEPWTNADVISDERLFYDDATSLTTPPTRGLVTKAERLSGFDSAGKPIYERMFTAEYDALGRQTKMTDGLNRTKQEIITPTYGPVTRVVEVAPNQEHKTTTEIEPAWGEAVAVTRPDGRRAAVSLDPLGREVKAWKLGSPTSGPADVEYSYLVRDREESVVTTKRRVDADTVDISYELYDGLQRLRQTQEPTPAGGWLVTDHRYDSRGNKIKENGPYFTDVAGESKIKLVDEKQLLKQELTTWDAAERPAAQSFKSRDEVLWEITHDVTATRQSIDPPAGQTPTTRILDTRGRLIELRQYLGSSATGSYDSTTYAYWPTGQLKTVTDPAGNKWGYEYDVQGRKIKESDPDKGATTYRYDAADQMISSTDARGVTLAYAYDENGRRTAVHRDSLQGPKLAAWTFDTLAAGQPVSATRYIARDGRTDAYTTAVTGYDAAGRPSGTSITLPASEGRLAGTYTVGQTYTKDDQVETRTLPEVGDLARETLTYGYNDQGLPTTLTGLATYVGATEYTPFEQPHVITRGSGTGRWVQEKLEYDQVTRRLTRVVVDKETLPRRVSDTNYEYDPAGNVTKITDKPSSTSLQPTDTQCFSYDYLRRLSAAWTPAPGSGNEAGDCSAAPTVANLGGPAPYWHKWTFDKTGNRKTEQKITAAGTTTSTYQYGANGKPHALANVTTTGPSGTSTKTFGYDATGNTNARTAGGVNEVLTWDEEGRLKDTTKGSTKSSFVYDADGNRLIRKDSSGTTLYLGETEIHLNTDGATVTGTRYYAFDDKVVGVRTGGKLSWLMTDLHGTPTTAIDEANQTVQRRRTTPYGETRGAAPANWPGQRNFHGGTSDPATGLVHLGAREYDPTIGRFISVDPVIDPQDPQQLNGYSYANNNPASYSDSDGQFAIVIAIPVLVTVIRVLITLIVSLIALLIEHREKIVREVVRSVWDFFSWMFKKIVETVVQWITFFVWVWKQIEQLVTTTIVETIVTMRTEVRHIPDKKSPRNSQGGKGNSGSKSSAPKAKQPAKPQAPKTPKKAPKQGPKKPDAKPRNDGKQSRGPQSKPEPKITKERLDHTFDRHAHEWFGRRVPQTSKLGEWRGLIEGASRSSKNVPWSSNGLATQAYLARFEGKWFLAQFNRSTGELVTAFVPQQRQLTAILRLLGM